MTPDQRERAFDRFWQGREARARAAWDWPSCRSWCRPTAAMSTCGRRPAVASTPSCNSRRSTPAEGVGDGVSRRRRPRRGPRRPRRTRLLRPPPRRPPRWSWAPEWPTWAMVHTVPTTDASTAAAETTMTAGPIQVGWVTPAATSSARFRSRTMTPVARIGMGRANHGIDSPISPCSSANSVSSTCSSSDSPLDWARRAEAKATKPSATTIQPMRRRAAPHTAMATVPTAARGTSTTAACTSRGRAGRPKSDSSSIPGILGRAPRATKGRRSRSARTWGRLCLPLAQSRPKGSRSSMAARLRRNIVRNMASARSERPAVA